METGDRDAFVVGDPDILDRCAASDSLCGGGGRVDDDECEDARDDGGGGD
jgi:hypothetical protein